jgi:hypothetical protein
MPIHGLMHILLGHATTDQETPDPARVAGLLAD